MINKKPFGLMLGLSLLLASCGQDNKNVTPDDKQSSNAITTTPAGDNIASDVIEGEYIVVLKENAKLGGISAQNVGQTQLTAQNITSGLGLNPQGLEIQHVYNSALKGFAGKLTPQHLDVLSKSNAVSYIEKNVRIERSQAQRTDRRTWGLDRIDQRESNLNGTFDPGATGKNVVAYIVDSGIRTSHSEFGNRAIWGTNTVDNIDRDCDGHGTHVAGIVGGKTYGVAKAATLVAVKTLDCQGGGSLAAITGALDWVRKNHNTGQFRGRPAIINMSINAPGHTVRVYDDAIRALSRANIAVVNSAGNENDNACSYGPANNAIAIVVGSSDRFNNRSDFSNWGNCVDLFAPGSGIRSAAHDSDYGSVEMDGSSMAAPHVTGAITLLLERNPNMTPAQIEARLIADSTKDALRGVGTGSPNRLLFIDRNAR